MLYSKYKENNPIETINSIRNILSEIGICPHELWAPTAPNLYAVMLRTKYIQKLSSGKGTTEHYALASAYGELIEGLENNRLGLFHMKNIPDEKIFSQKDFLSQDSIFLKKQFKNYLAPIYKNSDMVNPDSNEIILKKLLDIIENNKDSDVKCVPFYSVSENKVVYLPYSIISRIHLHTGMSSGNTPKEAIVQGISEIFERFAAYKISACSLVPPIIPEEEYKNYSVITNMLNYYKSKGFEIKIIDASLGLGFPVAGLIVFDKKTNQYCTSFGAHPSLPLAIERCFTEFRQERDSLINKTKNFLDIDFNKSKDSQSILNLYIYVANILKLDYKTFINKPDWEYNHNTWKFETLDNTELLHYLTNIVQQKNYNMYVRDVSFLGFPAYYTVIPELSPVFNDEDTLRKYVQRQRLNLYTEKYINNYSEFTEEDLKVLLSDIEFNLSLEILIFDNNCLSGIDDYLSAAACAYLLNDTDKAISYLDKYIQKYKNSTDLNVKNDVLEVKCLYSYLNLKNRGHSETEINKFLNNFYNEDLIKNVKSFWIDSNPLKNYILLSALNSKSDKSLVYALNKDNEYNQVVQNMEYKYLNNMPEQIKLSTVFHFE